MQAWKKSLADGRRSNNHQLAYEEIRVASSVLFSFVYLFFLTIVFSSLRFGRVGFYHGCAGHMPKINYWLTTVKLLDPLHASCTGVVQTVCILCTSSLVAALTQLLLSLTLLHMLGSTWCLSSLNRRSSFYERRCSRWVTDIYSVIARNMSDHLAYRIARYIKTIIYDNTVQVYCVSMRL